jgi:hypothetical protein
MFPGLVQLKSTRNRVHDRPGAPASSNNEHAPLSPGPAPGASANDDGLSRPTQRSLEHLSSTAGMPGNKPCSQDYVDPIRRFLNDDGALDRFAGLSIGGTSSPRRAPPGWEEYADLDDVWYGVDEVSDGTRSASVLHECNREDASSSVYIRPSDSPPLGFPSTRIDEEQEPSEGSVFTRASDRSSVSSNPPRRANITNFIAVANLTRH